MDTVDVWKANLQEAHDVLAKCMNDKDFLGSLQKFSDLVLNGYKSNQNLFACGNGGSHCDAMHLCEEFTGRYRKDRPPLGAIALGDPSHTTCVSNDYGFEYIFSRQLEGLARKGDILVALSTSGNSPNVINAVETARNKGLVTIALTGSTGGKLKNMVDLCLQVPANTSDRIQEIHIKIIHTVIQTTERALFPENYQ